MWNASSGQTTFFGPFALALAHCIQNMTVVLGVEIDFDDTCRYGHRAYDRLTNEQIIWSLHRVTFGLLNAETEIVPLSAYAEATIATIFRHMEICIGGEFLLAETDPDEDSSSIRRAVLAAYEQAGGNSPDKLMGDEEPLRVECDAPEKWKSAIEMLEESILWDSDYDLDVFEDMSPQSSGQLKGQLGILDDYFTAVPDDPKRQDAMRLLSETWKLCDRVIEREKKLNK